MGQTLTNGIFLPNEGERNCYTGLAGNWRALDYLIGGYNVHVADAVIHVSQADRDKWDAVDDKADASALTAHTGDTTIHVTAADKAKWDAVTSKADASALTAHTGDTTIHVTAADKAKWDAVTSKADDADVVHKDSTETIPGAKTFSTFITSDGSSIGDEYSGNAKTNFWLMGNRDTEEVSGVLFDTFRQNITQGTGTHILGIGIKENAVRYEGCRFSWIWDNNLNGYSFSIRPTLQGANQAVEHSLGTSIDKWDTINGINPGALSLPNLSAGVDISGYITAGATHNEYTPTVDGWISVILKKTTTSGALAIFLYQGDVSNSYFGNTALPNETEFCGMASIPVKAGSVVNIDLRGSNTYVYSAKFYPCMGNV